MSQVASTGLEPSSPVQMRPGSVVSPYVVRRRSALGTSAISSLFWFSHKLSDASMLVTLRTKPPCEHIRFHNFVQEEPSSRRGASIPRLVLLQPNEEQRSHSRRSRYSRSIHLCKEHPQSDAALSEQ